MFKDTITELIWLKPIIFRTRPNEARGQIMLWRHSTKRLLASLSGLVLAFLLLPANISAQDTAPDSVTQARKFDEFAQVRGCDHSARLDNFAISLMNEPEAIGYIIAYGPEGEGSGTGSFRLQVSKDYLVNSRGIVEERIKTIYGGRYKDLGDSVSELWIAPSWAPAPSTVKYDNNASAFTGKLVDDPTWDGLLIEADVSTGPPIGDVRLAAFADMLKVQPKARGYIVVYEGDDSAPGAWGRISKRESETLQRNYGISSDRTTIIFGGYKKEARLQLWILPNDAPPPVEEVRNERKLKRNVQLGTFGQYELKYEDSARAVFEEFATLLRKDQDLTVCIIVRLEPPTVVEASTEESIPVETVESNELPDPSADEPPDIDLVQLTDRWKRDLAKKYKISENRLVVMVAQAQDEFATGVIETWIIPPGSLLPDLYPNRDEATEEKEIAEDAPGSF